MSFTATGFLVLHGSAATVSLAFGSPVAIIKGLLKASPDDPKHPGWPAGTPGGLGGTFRPTDGAAKEKGTLAVKRLAMRRAIRVLLVQAISLPLEAAANLIPVLGQAADVVMVAQLAATSAEFHQLDLDTKAALDFIARGPYSLDNLRVLPDFESFSSYDEFRKSCAPDEIIALRFGRAGAGYQYHHIIEQGGTNAATFSAQELQSTDNIIRIPTLLHEAVNGAYSERADDTGGLTLREWLRAQPYSTQRERGIRVLRNLGIIE